MVPEDRSWNLSYEFFPPKTQEGARKLYLTASILKTTAPDFFSVTFGAGGSNRTGTLETIKELQPLQVELAPHLACMGMPHEALITLLHQYEALKIKRLVILRGDTAQGRDEVSSLNHANELVKLTREVTKERFHIEVAAYPEVHPEAPSAHADILNLKRKMEEGANSAITQYFFNPDAYFYFVEACRKQGIVFPIIPGIMPITSFERLARFSDLCGAEIPRWIRKRLADYANTEDLAKFGFDVILNLCLTLMRGGAPGFHFYTLNQAEPCCAIVNALDLRGSNFASNLKS